MLVPGHYHHPISGKPRGQAENPSGNHKDSKKNIWYWCRCTTLSAPACGRHVGDLSRSDAFGSGYIFRLDF